MTDSSVYSQKWPRVIGLISLVYGTLLAATYEPVFEITYFSLVADYFLIFIFFTGSVGLFLRKRWGVFWLVYGSVWRLMEGAFFVYFMMVLYEDVPFYAAALGILGSLIPFYGWPVFLLVWFATHKLETKTSATLLAEKVFHDFENRTRYPQLTREVLESIGERDFQSAVVDYVSLSLEVEDDSEIEIVSEMSPGIQAIYANWKVSADVRNGGFHQFFFNQGIDWAFIAVEGYQLLGAPRHKALLTSAIEIFLEEQREGKAFYRENVQITLVDYAEASRSSSLADLDEQFYQLEREEDLDRLAYEYMKSHLEEFITPERS